MTEGVSAMRAAAARAAKLLREKSRAEEAVLILSAAAAAGPNDAEGQELLAEALRIDPNAAVAQAAFARMEGVAGLAPDLDQAIAHYTLAELESLSKSLRPVFLKAQVGFNNNLKHQGAVYHVQTEDSGLDKPHVITHLFADGGRIIKSHKRTYTDHVQDDDVTNFVRTLMKGQHMEMVLQLREGKFDEVVAGRAKGGMEVFDFPPKVDLEKIGSRKKAKAKAKAASMAAAASGAVPAVVAAAPLAAAAPPAAGVTSPTATPRPVGAGGAFALGAMAVGPQAAAKPAAPEAKPPAEATGKVRLTLHVLRSLSGGPERYDPPGEEVVIGSEGAVALPGEVFCHPCEALIYYSEGRLLLEDMDGGNGVFLRIRRRVELTEGDEFIVGDQLLRLEANPLADDGPDPGPTYFRASLKGPSAFRVVQLFVGGAEGFVAMARDTTLQIGAINDDYYANDLVIPGDPLIEPYHCVIEHQADSFILSDFGARSGVFVRVMGTHELAHGDELLVGRTRLQVDLSPMESSLEPLG